MVSEVRNRVFPAPARLELFYRVRTSLSKGEVQWFDKLTTNGLGLITNGLGLTTNGVYRARTESVWRILTAAPV